jgi:hypothetical protein
VVKKVEAERTKVEKGRYEPPVLSCHELTSRMAPPHVRVWDLWLGEGLGNTPGS